MTSVRHRVIPFVKANACGNDFLIIDGVYAPADIAEFSRRICDRHHGVGADGVEWLFPAHGRGRAGAPVQCRWIGSGNFRQRHPLRGGVSLLREQCAETEDFRDPGNSDSLAPESRTAHSSVATNPSMSSKPPWASRRLETKLSDPGGHCAKCAAFRSPWEIRTTSCL